MISPKPITRKDAGDASVTKAIDSYYQEEKDDYYTREKQPSEWYGSLAQELGLNGHVEKKDFTELLEGKHKGETLRDSSFKRKNANDRLGMDLTFNAPKSVSIQALVAGDKRLIKAHHEAVRESLDMIGSNAQARKKVRGKTRVENTNNIAVAMFRHDTNRNNDPHLHTHSVVLNITKRGDGAYRALHNDKLVKKIPEASQAYQTNLAKKVKELGYDIRINDNGTFDLAHISHEQIKQFSTRSQQIEKALSERGLSRETATREERQMANFTTKQRKRLIDKSIIQEKWAKTAEKLGLDKVLTPEKVLKRKEKELSDERQSRNEYTGINRYTRATRDYGSDGANDQPITTRTRRGQNAEKDKLHELSSVNVADTTKRGKVLLQNNPQFQLHKQRATTIFGLRRSLHSGANGSAVDKFDKDFGKPGSRPKHQNQIPSINDAQSLNDRQYDTLQDAKHNQKETLKDMLEYEAPTTELTKKWGDMANQLGLDLEPGQAFNEPNNQFSGDKLMSHVVSHLTDKKVDLTRDEIIKEALIKGMGEVGAKEAETLLDKYLEKGDIVKAEPLYKTADDKGESTAKTIDAWISTIQENNNMSDDVAYKAIKKGIKDGRLLPLEERYVTKHDLQSENNILRIMKEGKGSTKAYYTQDESDKILEQTTLNKGQKESAKLIMTSKDRVIGIQGYAGVGKSYTLSQVLPQVEKTGSQAHVFAPYGKQVKGLREDGHDAHTVAKLLNSPSLQEKISENDLLVIDEAGVLPNKDAEKILKLAEDKNIKVVLLGDTQQTKAINSGKPFDLLQDNGMETSVIDEIQRQKDERLKKAVYEASISQAEKSIQTLGKSVYEIKDKASRLDHLVDKYMEYDEKERDNTLIVTGTNQDKDYINDQIRERTGLKGKGVITSQLKRVDMSRAEMKHARYYKEGQQVEIQTNPKNKELKKGAIYTVLSKDKNHLIAEDDNGKQVEINPTRENLAVYEARQFEVSKGDKLTVSKGDKELGTVTGDKLIVEDVNRQSILAKDSKTGNVHSFNVKDKNHLDYDYSSTVHSSQGSTVNNVLINIDTRSKTTSKELYYVAVSRARHNAIVLTDNTRKLPSAIAKGADKHSAYELTTPTKKANKQNELQHTKQQSHEYKREERELGM